MVTNRRKSKNPEAPTARPNALSKLPATKHSRPKESKVAEERMLPSYQPAA